MRSSQRRATADSTHAGPHAATKPRLHRVVMPDVELFADREDSVEVRELTRELCDVYAAQLADDDFQ